MRKREVEQAVSNPPSFNMFPDQKGNPSASVPSDFDLLNTTVKRISELEARVRLQAQEIQMKNQEIAMLQQKLDKLQKPGPSSQEKPMAELEKRFQELQKKVFDMEHFLSDYGLIWVGDEDLATSDEQKTSSSSDLGLSPNIFQPDFDLIVENLQDLNILGGDGVSKIQYGERSARLKPPEPVQLTLYKNGIIMFQGPFRSYQEPSTQQCLRDIMDGYFPSELQARFPEGVIFQVTDLREVVFRERRSWDEFPGTGQTVGDASGNIKETSKLPGLQLSVDQFLNRLPKSVVSSGRVLEIQGPLREALKGSKGERTQEILIDSPHVLSLEETPHTDAVVCTLRIKSENGDQTYKVRMLSSETLGDLRIYLSQYRTTNDAFDIINRFPHQVYNKDECCLQEVGLVPNAFLLLRKRNPKEPSRMHQQ
ncbi:UBX domain-containing protein 11 [Gastrophryne carolinensis]